MNRQLEELYPVRVVDRRRTGRRRKTMIERYDMEFWDSIATASEWETIVATTESIRFGRFTAERIVTK